MAATDYVSKVLYVGYLLASHLQRHAQAAPHAVLQQLLQRGLGAALYHDLWHVLH